MASRPKPATSQNTNTNITDKTHTVLDIKDFVKDIHNKVTTTQDMANSKGEEKTKKANELLNNYKVVVSKW